ncbi:MAG: hypothetical protein KKD11_00100 [Candidatus Omnitrophica bacterium]|nr:hypothetical protein [Candidatus Omnitrophota bacterium]
MKKLYILYSLVIVAIFVSSGLVFAATVGNSLDLDVPNVSAILKQTAVDQALDDYEQMIKIKASLDMEFLFDKDLNGPNEVAGAELKGEWNMVKLGVTIFDRVEPYIKIGAARLDAKWRQNSAWDIEVASDQGFAWGGGIKGIIWDFDDQGLRLTGDVQCRIADLDASDIERGGVSITDTGADFKVEEWQAAIALSKKYELPLKWQNIYLVPYTGLTFSDSTVDVSFKNPDDPAQDWTLYDANNESMFGFFLGCDIMPTISSSFIYSIEVRLVNEMALTLGGAMKF